MCYKIEEILKKLKKIIKPSEQKLKHALSNVSSIYEHNIVFCRSLFIFCLVFLFVIVFSVLRFTDSVCPFGFFKLFLRDNMVLSFK